MNRRTFMRRAIAAMAAGSTPLWIPTKTISIPSTVSHGFTARIVDKYVRAVQEKAVEFGAFLEWKTKGVSFRQFGVEVSKPYKWEPYPPQYIKPGKDWETFEIVDRGIPPVHVVNITQHHLLSDGTPFQYRSPIAVREQEVLSTRLTPEQFALNKIDTVKEELREASMVTTFDPKGMKCYEITSDSFEEKQAHGTRLRN